MTELSHGYGAGREGNVEKQKNGHFDSGWDSHCGCFFFPAGTGVAEGGDKKKSKKIGSCKKEASPYLEKGIIESVEILVLDVRYPVFEGTVLIFHKHKASHPYHQHGRANTLRHCEEQRKKL